MAQNLNVGKRVNTLNTASPHSDVSTNGIIEKYCYGNNPANCDIYGGFYDWNEMMNYNTTPGAQGICPPGWHVPTASESPTSYSYGLYYDYPAGTREPGGTFWGLGSENYWWTSELNAYGNGFGFKTSNTTFIHWYTTYREGGHSIRCKKD
jgi:hypothetical protein